MVSRVDSLRSDVVFAWRQIKRHKISHHSRDGASGGRAAGGPSVRRRSRRPLARGV